jgi:hypothetical protein
MRYFKVGDYFREDEENAVVLGLAKDRLIGDVVRSLSLSCHKMHLSG